MLMLTCVPGRYYEAQLQLPVECKGEGLPARRNKVAVCRMIPTSIITPMRLPIRMEQPLQMPVPATTREVHNAEKDPLRRMAPGYERYKRISLLYETSLAETFRQVGPEDGGGGRTEKVYGAPGSQMPPVGYPGRGCRSFCPGTSVRKRAGDGVAGDFRERFPERKTLQCQALYATADAGGDADGRVHDEAL